MSDDLFTRLARRAQGDGVHARPFIEPDLVPGDVDVVDEWGAPDRPAPATTATTALEPPTTSPRSDDPRRGEAPTVVQHHRADDAVAPPVRREPGAATAGTELPARPAVPAEHTVERVVDRRPAPAPSGPVTTPAAAPPAPKPGRPLVPLVAVVTAEQTVVATTPRSATTAAPPPPSIEISIDRIEILTSDGRPRHAAGRSAPATPTADDRRPQPALALADYLAQRSR